MENQWLEENELVDIYGVYSYPEIGLMMLSNARRFEIKGHQYDTQWNLVGLMVHEWRDDKGLQVTQKLMKLEDARKWFGEGSLKWKV